MTEPCASPVYAATCLPGVRHPLHILLAEDNPTNRDLCLHLLAELGWEADTVANGRDALQTISAAQPPYDLVLMDVRMPEMDGYETSLRLINRFPDPASRPRIIAVTANALLGDRARCLAAGMDDYLSKPLRSRDLETAIFRTVIGEEPPTSAPPQADAASPPAPSSKALVDFSQFDVIVPGPDSPCVALFHEYLQQVPDAIAAIRDAAAQNDADAVASKAHQFKGSSATFGLIRFSDLMRITEKDARAGVALDTMSTEEWANTALSLFTESCSLIRSSRGI